MQYMLYQIEWMKLINISEYKNIWKKIRLKFCLKYRSRAEDDMKSNVWNSKVCSNISLHNKIEAILIINPNYHNF